MLLSLILTGISLSNAAQDSDFDNLRVGIKTLYQENPRMIPLAVRLVFHDLLLQSTLAGQGCIESDSFMNNGLNNGLRTVVEELQKVVRNQSIPDGTFTFGDVIAFSGKLAVEAAYPCVNIPFMYHRSSCTTNITSDSPGSQPPSPSSMKMADYNDHVKYLGMNHSEFAILVVGGHGIRDASAHRPVSGWNGVFSTFSSGKDFISQTLNNTWISRLNPKLEFVSNTANTLLRIPSDMVFFPDVIPASQRDPSALQVQETLRNFTKQPRVKFDQAFAQVFAKLIARAGGKTIYRETENLGFCPEFPGDQPPQKESLKTAESTVSSAQNLSFSLVALLVLLFS